MVVERVEPGACGQLDATRQDRVVDDRGGMTGATVIEDPDRVVGLDAACQGINWSQPNDLSARHLVLLAGGAEVELAV